MVVGVAHVFIHLVLLPSVLVCKRYESERREKQLPIAGALENAIAPASCPPLFPFYSWWWLSVFPAPAKWRQLWRWQGNEIFKWPTRTVDKAEWYIVYWGILPIVESTLIVCCFSWLIPLKILNTSFEVKELAGPKSILLIWWIHFQGKKINLIVYWSWNWLNVYKKQNI